MKDLCARLALACVTTAALLASCVTINIYFPAAAVEKAADQIIRETWGTQEGGEEGGQDPGKPQGGLGKLMLYAVRAAGPASASAQEANIDITTPAIRAIKDSMGARAEQLKPYLDRGVVGIGSNGLLVVRDASPLDMKEKASLTRLVDKENGEREALYAELARANSFGPERVGDIRNIFAASWIRNARGGWWYQSPGGEWLQKARP